MIYPVEFKVAGVPHYYDEFFEKFSQENEDYSLTNAELKQEFSDGDRIFKYSYSFSKVELVPEPTNEHDPNAIRVEADGFLIGYIGKKDTARVKELLADPNFKYIKLEVGGGVYKAIYEDEDEKIQVEKDECGPFADVYIYLEKIFESAPVASEPVKEPSKLGGLLLGLGILNIILTLVLFLVNPIIAVVFLLFAIYLVIMGAKLKKKRKQYEDSLK